MPTVWAADTHTHTHTPQHTLHHYTPLVWVAHAPSNIADINRQIHTLHAIAHTHTHTHTPMQTSPAEALTITTSPCLVRVSQQQHVRQGVWKSLQLIKACWALGSPRIARHFKGPLLCVARPPVVNSPFNATTYPLNILPAPSFLFLSLRSSLHLSVVAIELVSLQFVCRGVNPLCSWCDCERVCVCVCVLHPIALCDCCNHVREKSITLSIFYHPTQNMASCSVSCTINKGYTHK